MISEHPFLQTLSPAYLKILNECAEERAFGPGEILFRQGERADRLYLIETGKVALEAQGASREDVAVQEVGPEDVVGASWLFPPCVWRFQARAIEPTRALSLDGGQLLSACERDHEFGYELMNRLAQVLIRRLQVAQEQLANLHAPSAVAW